MVKAVLNVLFSASPTPILPRGISFVLQLLWPLPFVLQLLWPLPFDIRSYRDRFHRHVPVGCEKML